MVGNFVVIRFHANDKPLHICLLKVRQQPMMIPMAETIKGGSCLIKSWSIFICFLDNNWLEIWGFICSFYVCLWKSNIHFICRKASAACHKWTVMIFLLSTANGFSWLPHLYAVLCSLLRMKVCFFSCFPKKGWLNLWKH